MLLINILNKIRESDDEEFRERKLTKSSGFIIREKRSGDSSIRVWQLEE